MQEELPFTEAMAAYVRWESRPWGTVAFIFVAAAVLPAVFTLI
ncbi:MAG TPA: hypothetical protein VFL27_08235 [Candidatus Dormibacteraeota bacterium]|nr:hypothetical protein [Candidatus Dormibacteraeota bacterium]